MSAIEWTDATWNPVTGCDRVSPGCANCYALTLAARLKRMGQPRYQRDGDPKSSGPGFGVTLHPDKLEEPLRWRKPRMVFVNSMSDLFHEEIPDAYIEQVFETMARAAGHTFQVLTKRPERMKRWVTWEWSRRFGGPLPNVWLGVSIENRRFVHRADLLRETPAAVRFVSAEPLLGPLIHDSDYVTNWSELTPREGGPPPDYATCWADGRACPELDLTGIDWLIVGGESGQKHRPVRPEWVRTLRDACTADRDLGPRTVPAGHTGPLPEIGGTAFFFKQWGGRTPKAGGRELDGRTWDEFPLVRLNAEVVAVDAEVCV